MIRALSPDELPAAAHLAAAAFREDPGFAYILPDDAARRLRLPSMIEALLRANLSSGARVNGAFDGDALIGVSLILPAGTPPPRLRSWLKHSRGLAWLLADPTAMLRSFALADAVERHRPLADDYLEMIAVHPATQGRGVGAALLRDAFKSGKPLYLETFVESSLAWYEARGFKCLTAVASPVRPTFWTLKRLPRQLIPE